MQNRTVTIQKNSIHLARGEILDTLTFRNWELGLMPGLMTFTNAAGDSLNFWANETYVKDTLTGICYAMRTDIKGDVTWPFEYCRKKDIPDSLIKFQLKPQSRWHVIYHYSIDYDSVVLGGRCNYTGRNIQVFWPLDQPLTTAQRLIPDSFSAYLRSEKSLDKRYCRCPEDPAMTGTFEDKLSGESLKIQLNPLQVWYRSKNKPQWQELHVQQVFPGWLVVSFTADFSKETYALYFTGDTWMLPGETWPKKSNPQFFQPIK